MQAALLILTAALGAIKFLKGSSRMIINPFLQARHMPSNHSSWLQERISGGGGSAANLIVKATCVANICFVDRRAGTSL